MGRDILALSARCRRGDGAADHCGRRSDRINPACAGESALLHPANPSAILLRITVDASLDCGSRSGAEAAWGASAERSGYAPSGGNSGVPARLPSTYVLDAGPAVKV